MQTNFRQQVRTLRLIRWPLGCFFLFCVGMVFDAGSAFSSGDEEAKGPQAPSLAGAVVAATPKTSEQPPVRSVAPPVKPTEALSQNPAASPSPADGNNEELI